MTASPATSRSRSPTPRCPPSHWHRAGIEAGCDSHDAHAPDAHRTATRARMTVNPLRISIIGGGIGGLTAALALQHFGFRVSLFEQARELREIGAGVVISPNAMHALNF